ncbi:MAG: hydrogenase formation protein HypD [Phycisphaerae bacterium]|nr:hydrogenase formation protein HypD [Phycisphaerae bacterium]
MLERINRAYKQIARANQVLGRRINVMEVCGTHTASIFRAGLRDALPDCLKLLSGPGCPLCVTEQGYIDAVLSLAERNDIIIAVCNDMIRIPGKSGSLEQKIEKGNVKTISAANDVLNIAKQMPDKKVFFAAIGFENAAIETAALANETMNWGIKNLFIFSSHKLLAPAMEKLLTEKNPNIDAFICPGHISVITGSDAYKPIIEKFKKPCVISGFEPMQIIVAISEICRQLADGESDIVSFYDSVVTPQGDEIAQKTINENFDIVDGCWQGLGKIARSTLKLKEKFSSLDAEKQLGIQITARQDITGCRGNEVLCGLIDPVECSLFANPCTPDTPLGPCMADSHGACAACYKYNNRKRQNY